MKPLASHYPVIIIGGGPVGLALANELGWRGIDYLLVDQGDGKVTFPAGENFFSRSMEFLRRWGIADGIRYSDAFPSERPRTMGFASTFKGRMIATVKGTSNADGPRSDPHSPEGPLFIPKRAFDPALLAGARRHAVGDVRYGFRMESFEQEASGVVVTVTDLATGATNTIRADYLAACDGGRSEVRKRLAIPFIGTFGEGYNFAIYFRAPGLRDLILRRFGQDYAQIHTINAFRRPYLTAVDGLADWRLSMYVQPGDEPNPATVIAEEIDPDLPVEILSAQPWTGHRVVARQYRSGRVFLLGDAAHLRWPKGGFGANTGFGDAVDLGWKIAAVLEGWGGEHLLDSYDTERRPIAIRNTNEAANNRVFDAMIEPDALLDAEGEAGDLARANMRDRIFALRLREFQTAGIQLGYRYRNSPICVQDESLEPPDDHMLYRPSTFPGGRAPHAWLSPGRSTLDLFGRGFVLMNFGKREAGEDFARVGCEAGVPFTAVHIENAEIAALYERRYVLVRPDGHVAWRGDTLPERPADVLVRIVGSEPAGR